VSDAGYTAPAPAGAALPRGPIGETRSVGLAIIWFILTCGAYGIYWTGNTMEELKRYTTSGLGGVASVIIFVVLWPFGPFIIAFVTAAEVGAMYGRDGYERPVSGLTGFWTFIPIAGPVIWFVKVQRALNRYWVSKGGRPV
jgi:hypothetical protein